MRFIPFKLEDYDFLYYKNSIFCALKYLLNKTEDDLNDYGYNSIAPITEKEKLEIFESDEFFKGLEFKEGFLEFFKRNKKNVNFVVATKGTPANLEKKEKWLKKNLSKKIKFIGINNKDFSKKQVNMAGSIQIDDFITSLDTNADLKILYKDNHSFEWQTNYINTNIVVVNTWEEIDDILTFYSDYDYKTLSKKGD